MVARMNAPAFPSQSSNARGKVACRPIEDGDIGSLVDLLAEGFPRRRRSHWSNGLKRMAKRPPVAGCQKYGYAIVADEAIVGCLLLIASEREAEGRRSVRVNVSSWYVRPEYRFHASMLVSIAFRQKGVTLLNISPAPHTIPILEAQGYKCYASGQFVTAPAFASGRSAQIVRVRPDTDDQDLRGLDCIDLLRRHASYGCISLVCRDGDRIEPFVFARRRVVRTIIPAAQLLWCRDIDAFRAFAGPIGRHLLGRGVFMVSLDANGPIEGLRGSYRDGNGPKFFRGPEQPRLGDLADTEIAIFGA